MKKKAIVIALIIVVIAASVYFKIQNDNTLAVETFKVNKGEISEYIEETGTVKSKKQRTIYTKAMGEARGINIDEGDRVKKGDILLEIDAEKINLEINSVQAEIDGLRAVYKEAVKPVDKSMIEKANANVESMKVKVDEAKRNFDSSKKLYEDGALSLNEYKSAQNNLTFQKNALVIAENELKLLKEGVSGNIKNQYQAQIAALVYKKEILEKNRENYVITSPIDGIITDIFIKEGSYLQPGMSVIEISGTNDLYIEVDVLASEVSSIKKDGIVIAYSDELGIDELSGKVDKIYPKAFSKISDLGIQQKRVRVDVDIQNISQLRIGYDIDTKFRLWSKNDVLLVPDNTVFELNDAKYVFIVEDDKAKLKKIEIGLEGEDYIEVKSGLNEGDIVIISPNEDIKEGINIKEKK
ncbi:efflux RND transporter periplasmic adaptor subunit [Abyssisolibacter fermentans]|uniref:efflux RND transporter periplasmic adaptor subunit n=1 Tax=Abyssisolibacter fermentans TaxID=1766203 RepID=UPI00082CE0A9|nr:efflux RND transporter periplasmic adaptor subunit [Abyssisolibacter fermentans]